MSGAISAQPTPTALALPIGLVTKQPAANYSDWLFTKGDDYRAPDSRPDVVAMQKNLDIQKQLGMLKMDIDVKAYSDLSLVDEASARLK